MKKAVSSLGLILALSPVAQAMADANFYLGARVGAATMEGGCDGYVACDNEDVTGGLIAGYNFGSVFFLKGLSIEGTYDHLGEFDFSQEYQIGVYRSKVTAYTLAPKFDFGLTDTTSLFGKVGAAWWDTSYDTNGTSLLAGVGIDHRATDLLNLRLEYQYIPEITGATAQLTQTGTVSASNNHAVYAGMTFHFGRAPLYAAVEPTPSLEEEPFVEETVYEEIEPAVEIQTIPADKTVVEFAFESSVLEHDEQGQLAAMLERLQTYEASTATIVGFTDSTGPEEFNVGLSQDRARTVAEFFIQNGIAVERLSVEAQGDNAPIASNATLDGRKQNRRVEVTSNGFEYQG